MDFKNNLNSVLSEMENLCVSKTVVGEPVQVRDITLIPVITISMGAAGIGANRDSKEEAGFLPGLGIGSGVKIVPNAVIVLRESEVSVLPIT